jgi:hypothetical protein
MEIAALEDALANPRRKRKNKARRHGRRSGRRTVVTKVVYRNPRRKSRRRRYHHNPGILGGLKRGLGGSIGRTAGMVAVGGAGAVLLKKGLQYLLPQLQARFPQVNWSGGAGTAAKVAAAVALGVLAKKALPKYAGAIAGGAAALVGVDIYEQYIAPRLGGGLPSLPAGTAGLGEVVPPGSAANRLPAAAEAPWSNPWGN